MSIDSQERVDGIIDEFIHNVNTPTVFPGIPKLDFLHSLRNNIKNPRSINQCNNGCCGATAVSKYMAEERPELYVRTAISLYTTGKSVNNGVTLSVTKDMTTGTMFDL